MASCSKTFTVDQILAYLLDNFNIPNDGLNSDTEGFEEEDSHDGEGNFFPDPDMETADNEVTLAAVNVQELSPTEASAPRGRPRKIYVNEYEWSSKARNVNILGFTLPIR